MNWQDFFKLTVARTGKQGEEIFFKAELQTPHEFPMHDLIISRFNHLNLSPIEKKKLSIGMRKIILCHELFQTTNFKKICTEFKNKIAHSSETELTFSTQGGGIYLFLHLIKDSQLKGKKITCYTSELPLPIMSLKKHPDVQIIYRPHSQSYLTDFSTLWKESEVMSLFELKDYKASA
jgi:hypothetical protein